MPEGDGAKGDGPMKKFGGLKPLENLSDSQQSGLPVYTPMEAVNRSVDRVEQFTFRTAGNPITERKPEVPGSFSFAGTSSNRTLEQPANPAGPAKPILLSSESEAQAEPVIHRDTPTMDLAEQSPNKLMASPNNLLSSDGSQRVSLEDDELGVQKTMSARAETLIQSIDTIQGRYPKDRNSEGSDNVPEIAPPLQTQKT